LDPSSTASVTESRPSNNNSHPTTTTTTTTTTTQNDEHLVEAELVKPDDTIVIMARQVSDNATAGRRPKSILIAVSSFLMVAVIIIVVLVVVFVAKKDDSTNDKETQTNSPIYNVMTTLPRPTPAPTPVYIRNWVQQGDVMYGERNETFGTGETVALSRDGSILAMGGGQSSSSAGGDTGHVQVMKWNISTMNWDPLGNRFDGDPFTSMGAEKSVSLSGNGRRVAIGSPFSLPSGLAQVFEYMAPQNAWHQMGQNITGLDVPSNAGVCTVLSEDGTVLVVGDQVFAVSETTGEFIYPGRLQTYEWAHETEDSEGGVWKSRGTIEALTDYDGIGTRVALSSDGSVMVVGAMEWGMESMSFDNPGQVRVYSWNGTAWNQSSLPINGTTSGESFGNEVAMSYDGGTIAVSKKPTTGIGAVTVFTKNTNNTGMVDEWIQLGTTLQGQAGERNFGSAISLSGNNRRLAVASELSVAVFEWMKSEADWEIIGNFSADLPITGLALSQNGTVLVIGAPGLGSLAETSGPTVVYKWV